MTARSSLKPSKARAAWRARVDAVAPTDSALGVTTLDGVAAAWHVYRTARGRTLYVSTCRRMAVVQSPAGRAWLALVGRVRLPGFNRTPAGAAAKAAQELATRQRELLQLQQLQRGKQ